MSKNAHQLKQKTALLSFKIFARLQDYEGHILEKVLHTSLIKYTALKIDTEKIKTIAKGKECKNEGRRHFQSETG